MLAEERRQLIALKLKNEKRVSVSELSKTFAVHEETIRRDLEKLEMDGLAHRCYGGAIYNEDEHKETPYDVRRRADVEAKNAIALLTADLIADGEYIMLDDSSTSFFIAAGLKNHKDMTIITNSMEIVNEVAGIEGWTVLCTGGRKRMSAPSFAGTQAENMVRGYHVDKAIISCDSLDIAAGYTDRHEDTAHIKKAMMASAREVILAVDHSKFDRVAFAEIGNLDALHCVITDEKPQQEWLDAFAKRNIKILYGSGRKES